MMHLGNDYVGPHRLRRVVRPSPRRYHRHLHFDKSVNIYYDVRVTKPDGQFISNSPQETMDYAAAWVKTLPAGTVIALHGDLGTGKTCFVQGLAKGLDVHSSVHSPTFTLINEYRGILPLYHLDLYRLRGEEDAWEIGIEHYLPGDGITAIEWADRITRILPPLTLHVKMAYGENPHVRVIDIHDCVPK